MDGYETYDDRASTITHIHLIGYEKCTNQSRQDCGRDPAGSHGTLGCGAAGSS